MSQPSREKQGQISAPPALACSTSCLLLCKTSFSWQQKKSETCVYCAGGAEQHMERAAAPQCTEPCSTQQDLPCHRPAPSSCTRCLLLLPCQGTSPTVISLFVLRSGLSHCITSVSVYFTSGLRYRYWLWLQTTFPGTPATSGKARGLCCCPVQRSSDAGNASIK